MDIIMSFLDLTNRWDILSLRSEQVDFIENCKEVKLRCSLSWIPPPFHILGV